MPSCSMFHQMSFLGVDVKNHCVLEHKASSSNNPTSNTMFSVVPTPTVPSRKVDNLDCPAAGNSDMHVFKI